MTATLILLVCLSSSPAVCREETPPLDPISPVACAVLGQQMAQQWLGDHPKWTLKGWRCRTGTPARGA